LSPRLARSANTMASLCAINMFCVEAPAPPLSRTFARPTATSSLRMHSGNLWGCGSRRTSAMRKHLERAPRLYDFAPEQQLFQEDVLRGLQTEPKTLPSKYFYDDQGSQLFEQICAQDEYYLTRTELS